MTIKNSFGKPLFFLHALLFLSTLFPFLLPYTSCQRKHFGMEINICGVLLYAMHFTRYSFSPRRSGEARRMHQSGTASRKPLQPKRCYSDSFIWKLNLVSVPDLAKLGNCNFYKVDSKDSCTNQEKNKNKTTFINYNEIQLPRSPLTKAFLPCKVMYQKSNYSQNIV